MNRRRPNFRRGGIRRRGISNPFAGLIVGPFLMVFGAILLIVGWGWYGKTNEWAAAGGTAMGTVVEMKQYEKTSDNGTTIMYQPLKKKKKKKTSNNATTIIYHPLIELKTETGEVILYTDPTSSISPVSVLNSM